MANSIAKLAVKITTDTSGMVTGFNVASDKTRKFAAEVSSGGDALRRLGNVGVDAAKDIAGLGGAGKLAVKFGGIAGPIGLAAAAVGVLATGLARAADASADFRIEKLREFGLAAPGVKTLADLLGELREQFGIFAELSGFSLKPIIDQASQLSRAFSGLLFGEAAIKNLERQNAEAKGLAEKMKRIKEEEEARFKLADEMSKKSIDIIKQGEQIAKSLRTPDEIFRDTITELKELADVGAIVGDTLQRGIARAGAEFMATAKTVNDLKNEIKSVPALEQGGAAFRSAVLASRQQPGTSAEQIRLEREQVTIQKRIASATEAVLGKPQVTFIRGNL